MKVLLIRFGGIGDSFPVSVAARILSKQGHEVTILLRDDGAVTKQSVLFSNDPDFKVVDMEEIGPWKSRVIEYKNGFIEPRAFYKDYDLIIDFMGVVENNSTSIVNNMKDPWEFWQRSRSSNWVNWYDLHLAWCNIDPTQVSEEEKRPKLFLTDEEIKTAEYFKAEYDKLFVISPYASSLSRSWYQAEKLIEPLLKDYPNSAVAFWNPGKSAWNLVTSQGMGKLPKLAFNPLRETMALIHASDLVISVDTGAGHIAEALGKKSLVIYSTVPAWTRNQYYENQTHIDPGETSHDLYTFSLGLGDPLRVKAGIAELSERESTLKAMIDAKEPIEKLMEALNTDKRGVELEAQNLAGKIESWERQQSIALSSVKPDEVLNRIKEIVHV
jgi:ADP-heptose:LPS heptosyltransferase